MNREIPWVYAEEIDWNVGDVWLVELKDEVVAERSCLPWQVVKVGSRGDGDFFYLHTNNYMRLDSTHVWRGLCLEKSETA